MKPLEGIKVVELATYLAAPSCARILGDWGASVIKVEAPSGDPYRTSGPGQRVPDIGDNNPVYDSVNPNKQFVAINLKDPKGLEVLMKLLEDADVFLTNTRPKALKKLGITYEGLSERFPRLIYADVLGYGETGPDKDRPAYDYTTFYARTGMMADMPPKGQDVLNAIPGLGDHVVGGFLAGGICAALYRRSVTGTGDRVDAGLFQAGIYTLANGMIQAYFGREYPRERVDGSTPISNTYKCGDGEWVYMAAANYYANWDKICRHIIGRPDLADDPNYATPAGAVADMRKLVPIFEEIFASKPSSHWLKLFEEYDVPHERVAHFKDLPTDEQALANNYIREVSYPMGEKAVYSNTPVTFASFSDTDFELAKTTGADTRTVLAAAGYSDAEIDALAATGAVKI